MSESVYSTEEEASSASHPLESGIPSVFPQDLSPQVPSYGLNPYASPFEGSTPKVEYPAFEHNQSPFITYSRDFPNSDAASSVDEFSDTQSLHASSYGMNSLMNELSSRRRDENIRIRNEILSRGMEEDAHHEIQHLMEQLQQLNGKPSRQRRDTFLGSDLSSSGGRNDGMDHLLSRRYRNNSIRNSVSSERDKVISISNGFPLSIPDQGIHLSENLMDKRMVDIANQLLAVREGNDTDAENLDFASHVSLNDISIEYWQLYAHKRPENYDFAMNLMAYIELLNDGSWKATNSYFDGNVKRLVKYIWSEKHVEFNKKINLRRSNRDMVVKLMVDFTQWSININFDLGQFLNYCVLICQLGVISRKHVFKEASLYAISQLRDRIKLLKFKNFVEFMFEIAVKEYAQKLVDHSRV